jgi:putative membrane protein
MAVACMNDDDDNSFNTVSERDERFLLNASDGGMFEVKAGELAVAKGDSIGYTIHSDSLSVRLFGQMMITDHIKANDELKTLADQRQVAVPTTLSALKQQKIDSLSAANGVAFNALYIKMMVSSHQETIGLFQGESNAGDDNEIKSWAAGKLPTLEDHLDMAKMMQDSIR